MISLAAIVVGFASVAEPALTAERLYVGLNRPILVSIEGLGEGARWAASVQEIDGTELFRLDSITSTSVDLAQVWPAVWSIQQTLFLQAVVDGEPAGSALVIQPMRNRSPVRTGDAMRPDGKTPYTRIIGWGEELFDAENTEHLKLKESWKPGEPVVMSGVRVYPERDVLIETTKGKIRVALRPDEAPNTAWNFRHLVEGGFYDETTFHRVVPADRAGRPFVIQGGDPTGTGDGGAGWDLPIERSRLGHDFGVISMARGDHPDSAGTQFFFALSREGTARLDTQYCAFGEAVDGAETILAIASVEIADPATGRPTDPTTVTRASLIPAPARSRDIGRPDRRVVVPAPKEAETTESGHLAR